MHIKIIYGICKNVWYYSYLWAHSMKIKARIYVFETTWMMAKQTKNFGFMGDDERVLKTLIPLIQSQSHCINQKWLGYRVSIWTSVWLIALMAKLMWSSYIKRRKFALTGTSRHTVRYYMLQKCEKSVNRAWLQTQRCLKFMLVKTHFELIT